MIDVVMIVLDDMRSSDWRALPQTQALMSGGTTFPNYILTSPVCAASRINMLTGCLGKTTGVVKNVVDGRPAWRVIADNGFETKTIAKLMADNGYPCGLFGKYLNNYPRNRIPPPGWSRFFEAIAYTDPLVNVDGTAKQFYGNATDILTYAMLGYVGDQSRMPRFTYFAPYQPHVPTVWEPEYADEFMDAEGHDQERLRSLLSVDEAVVRLANKMGSRWDDALVIVTSDNGVMMDDGTPSKGVPYDACIRVPMMIKGPGFYPETDEGLMANVDILPNIAGAVNSYIPWPIDGRISEWGSVLIQGHPSNPDIPAWVGIRTLYETYVEWADGTATLWDRRIDNEETNQLRDVEQQEEWHQWLMTLMS